MSAKDDYKWPSQFNGDPVGAARQYGAMCDEIDRLRAQLKADEMVRSAVDSLTRELTVHADAMSGAIKMICSATDDELDHLIVEADGCAEAYDEFVREC